MRANFKDRVKQQTFSISTTIKHRKIDTYYQGVKADEFDFNDEYNKKIVDLVKEDVHLFARKLQPKELEEVLFSKAINQRWPLHKSELEKRVQDYVREVHGYGILDPLMNTDGITDIRIVNCKIKFWYKGKQHTYKLAFKSNEEVMQWVERKLRHTPFSYSPADGSLDAYLIDGSRINIKGETTGTSWFDSNNKYHYEECPIISIRRFGGFISLQNLFRIHDGPITDEDRQRRLGPKWAYEFMKLTFGLGLHSLFIGNTGSGKTTTANAASEHAAELIIPKSNDEESDLPFSDLDEVNATMYCAEEAPESQPFFKGLILRASDRLKNAEKQGHIDMAKNLKDALRMFIQILFIGEMRTPEIVGMFREAVFMGNKIVYSTYHSESADLGLNRFEQQLAVAPGTGGREIARFDTSNVLKCIFYQERIGSRIRLKEIVEICGLDEKGEYKKKNVAVWKPTGRNDEGLIDGRLYFNGVSERTKELCRQYGLEDLLQKIEDLAREEGLLIVGE